MDYGTTVFMALALLGVAVAMLVFRIENIQLRPILEDYLRKQKEEIREWWGRVGNISNGCKGGDKQWQRKTL